MKAVLVGLFGMIVGVGAVAEEAFEPEAETAMESVYCSNTVSGIDNYAFGCGNVVSGISNIVYGDNNVVSGIGNRVCGNGLVVSGYYGNYGCS